MVLFCPLNVYTLTVEHIMKYFTCKRQISNIAKANNISFLSLRSEFSSGLHSSTNFFLKHSYCDVVPSARPHCPNEMRVDRFLPKQRLKIYNKQMFKMFYNTQNQRKLFSLIIPMCTIKQLTFLRLISQTVDVIGLN